MSQLIAARLALICLAAVLPGTIFAATPEDGQRVILVTGSTGGLGREVARALASSGDHVIIHGRNVKRGQALVNEIAEEGRGSARFYRADFGSLAEVEALAQSVIQDYDRLDVLVNNAGVFLPDDNERRLSDDGYELHFQVNYLAGYQLTTELLPLLEASAPGRIVNVASGQRAIDLADLMVEHGYEGLDAYLRSKHAQVLMTVEMADDLAARGITINALHPSSLMDTDMVIEAGIEPQSSVQTGRDAVLRIINEDVGHGKYFNVFEEWEPIEQTFDANVRRALLAASRRLVDDAIGESAPD